MNKSEFIDAVAAKADTSKATAARAVNAAIELIGETLAKGDAVALVGFGTFEARKRAARTGKNPATGASIKIPATTVPAFKAGKGLKDQVAAGKKGKKK
ncbi:HU family DNA-binding protein [Thiobacillus denitrificans]|uniref:HU family DNA-binding protein n=1 Tax=Thiobacillus denitrificans TaxID=36861 RepID=UPI00036F23C0|nr:HU family DNA-binding protein [Thiobacillus denitrificans]